MGWTIMIGLAALVGLGLGFFLRRDKGALQFLGAALLLALAGYSWQGHPGFAGAPKRPPERELRPESQFTKAREEMLGRFDRAAYWLNLADAYQRHGDTASAAQLLQTAVQRNPRDPDLWVGLGNALVVHGGGMMSPAAQLAFSRAAQIAPDHPGPPFFYGLALAQGGNFDEAERIWRRLIENAPPGAQYPNVIRRQLEQLRRARAAGAPPSR